VGTRDIRSHAVQSAAGDNREDFNILSASPCGLKVQGRSSAFSKVIDANKKFLKVRITPRSEARDYAGGFGELLVPRPTPKLEDHRLSAVRDCPSYWRPFIRNPRTRDAEVKGTSGGHL